MASTNINNRFNFNHTPRDRATPSPIMQGIFSGANGQHGGSASPIGSRQFTFQQHPTGKDGADSPVNSWSSSSADSGTFLISSPNINNAGKSCLSKDESCQKNVSLCSADGGMATSTSSCDEDNWRVLKNPSAPSGGRFEREENLGSRSSGGVETEEQLFNLLRQLTKNYGSSMANHGHLGGGGNKASAGMERAGAEETATRLAQKLAAGNATSAVAGASHFQSLLSSTSQPQNVEKKRYKTEICRKFMSNPNGHCEYGEKCQYAHGLEELRLPSRHPRYKTQPCTQFHTTGICPYGRRCDFVHNESNEQLDEVRLQISLYHEYRKAYPNFEDISVAQLRDSLLMANILATQTSLQEGGGLNKQTV